ncbi:RES family NAD+ phosphorylase [Povalibacter sp.]|uniref:RES family NAD+ phosphorylase n=1 Tax=Povalibacter sp. TaxID=1962978 RepID=UPI002F420696
MSSGKDAQLRVTRDSQGDWHRNIVSLRKSIDLFADLVDDPRDIDVLVRHEMAVKQAYQEPAVIQRPFEEAANYDAIAAAIRWPFEHPCNSRYSNGTYGVWYGATSIETSVRETVHHFRRNTLASAIAAQSTRPIVQERRVHLIRCSALLVDLRARTRKESQLLHPEDYSYCQTLGRELRDAGMPGVLTYSARHGRSEVVAVFTPTVLSEPRTVCYLTYKLFADSGKVSVERTPGKIEWELLP